MKYFLGIEPNAQKHFEVMKKANSTKHLLLSFAACPDYEKMNNIINSFDQSFDFIIDSGAFSVWSSGKAPIDRNELLNFYKHIDKSKHNVWFINLDIIPAVRGQKPTRLEAKQACEQGWDNYLFFKKNGVQVLPVFHEDDEWEYLEKMKKENVYMCISPANDSSLKKRMLWLDGVFKDIKGNYKTHGLAATSKKILERYPFYSVDSINWKAPLLFGRSAASDNRSISKIARDGNNHYDILKREVEYYKNLQDYITRLWESRGIKWQK